MRFRGSVRQRRGQAGGLRVMVLLILLGVLLAGCAGLVLHPERQHRANPDLAAYQREDLFVQSGDGLRLHGWVLRPDRQASGSVVFFHGNAENISTHVNAVLWLVDAGYRVYLVDYRGFGRSEGEAEVAGAHADASTFLAAVLSRPEVDPRRVAVLGQSFGGAAAIYAVANSPRREQLRLLVVDSSFASYSMLAREKSAACCLTWPLQGVVAARFDDLDRRYAPERWVGRVAPVPVLFLHGDRDRVVPSRHGRLLFQRAPEPKGWWVVEGGGHTRAFASPSLRRELLHLLAQRLGEGAHSGDAR